ncbi:hypothetical protein L6452_01020 [Arctium lappa]|uniref:Uncharacterized protein n=1 Tax=Arctium lappa TaxID=4217 RepID=A0ACB9FGD5_ARCLA|nr:hypothetical protein L6452_01020 [Arctium lappa]
MPTTRASPGGGYAITWASLGGGRVTTGQHHAEPGLHGSRVTLSQAPGPWQSGVSEPRRAKGNGGWGSGHLEELNMHEGLQRHELLLHLTYLLL